MLILQRALLIVEDFIQQLFSTVFEIFLYFVAFFGLKHAPGEVEFARALVTLTGTVDKDVWNINLVEGIMNLLLNPFLKFSIILYFLRLLELFG